MAKKEAPQSLAQQFVEMLQSHAEEYGSQLNLKGLNWKKSKAGNAFAVLSEVGGYAPKPVAYFTAGGRKLRLGAKMSVIVTDVTDGEGSVGGGANNVW